MKKVKLFKSNKAILALIVLVLAIAVINISLSNNYTAFAESFSNTDGVMYEQKIISSSTLEDDFDDSCILVVMDKYTSKVNKKHGSKLSKIESIKSIKDLTAISGDIESKKYLDKDNFRQILKIELAEKSKKNVLNTIRKLEKIDGVLWAGANEYDQPDTLPEASNGIRYPQLWGLHGTNGINVEGAWDYTTGGIVTVGVIDSGIAEHADLEGNLMASSGWDFFNDNDIANDDVSGHGTHVAGTIGATGNNINGIVGVSQNVWLVPLQVANTAGTWPLDAVTAAIGYATDNNIDILNYSGGGASDNVARRTALSNYTGLFVCAAGNNGNDNDLSAYYPSDYSQGQTFSNRVISVASINSVGNISSFSNYGSSSVSIFAPGEGILSTQGTSGYASWNGTSMATPHVTGAAALMFSMYLKNAHGMNDTDIATQTKSTLIRNSTYDSRYSSYCSSGGRLDINQAVRNSPYRTTMSGFGYNSSWYRWNGKVDLAISNIYSISLNPTDVLIIDRSVNLNFSVGTEFAYNAWFEILSTMTFTLRDSVGNIINIGDDSSHTSTARTSLISTVTYTNRSFTINTGSLENDTYTLTMNNNSLRNGVGYSQTLTYTFIVNKTASCIAEGSLITLADGSQVAVEDLTGDEQLLVWNMFTGEFDAAPILFIDSDPEREYEVINLTFSDGTVVKVIDEHGFWNVDLNEYVFLRRDAAKYIGNRFNKQTTDENGNIIWTAVQLTDVELTNEQTTAYSPVTYGHLCYYVNGMLSMPGATTGLINIFEVDSETMRIDEAAYLADIAEYGLFIYEEFAELVPVPEEIFNAFNGQYLKVAMGKGLIDANGLVELVERYAEFFDMETPDENPDNPSNGNSGNNGNHYGHSNGNNGNSR